MRKFKNFVIGGIENKIFNLVAITVILIMAAYTAIIVVQSNKLSAIVEESGDSQVESMTTISNATMDAVVSESLTTQTVLSADLSDTVFGNVRSQVLMIADYATKLYANPDINNHVVVPTPDLCADGEPVAYLVYDEGIDPTDYDIASEVGILGNIAEMMKSTYDRTIIDACYIGTESGFTIFADDAPSVKVGADGRALTYPARQRPWYIEAKERGDVFFTDIIPDNYTGEYGVICSCPVYDPAGELKAVIGVDLFIDSMIEQINDSDKDGSFVFVVNGDGHVIVSPKSEGLFAVKSENEAVDLRGMRNENLSAIINTALNENTGVREIEVDGAVYYMCGAPIPTMDWAFISAVSKDVTRQPTVMLQEGYQSITQEAVAKYNDSLGNAKSAIIIILVVILLLAIVNGIVLARRIVRPLNKMSKQVSELNGDNLDFIKDKSFYTDDEIEVLADAFLGLTNRTKSYINEITHITAEKERISAELNVATQIQADMLPRIFPPFPERKEFDLYASMNPAKEVGGDFYDFFLTDDEHLALVMADVSGKGVPAALFMVIAKTLIKNRAQMGGTPAEILKDVNEKLCEGNETELFVTVWLAIVDIKSGEGIAANAGHEHPVLCHENGEFELIKYKHSPAVATMEGLSFREHEFTLKPGDTLFVYTDGVPEATNLDDEGFGYERLLKVLNDSRDTDIKTVTENVAADIEEFGGGTEQFDDITMLCLKYYG